MQEEGCERRGVGHAWRETRRGVYGGRPIRALMVFGLVSKPVGMLLGIGLV